MPNYPKTSSSIRYSLPDDVRSSVRFGGFDCIIPSTEPALASAIGKANSYWNPLGEESGRGYVLMLKGDVKTLVDAGPHGYALEFSDGKVTVKAKNLYILRADRLTPGDPESKTAVYLVELVDRRWFAKVWSDTGVLQFNIRSFAQEYNGTGNLFGFMFDEDTQDYGGKDISEIITAMWTPLASILGPMPTLPDAIADGTRAGFENLLFAGQSAWHAINVICARAGYAISYNHAFDDFSFADMTVVQEDFPANGLKNSSIVRDADCFDVAHSVLPETVRVYFTKHFANIGQENDTDPGTDSRKNWLQEPFEFSDVAVSSIEGAESALVMPGTVMPIWSDRVGFMDYANIGGAVSAFAASLANFWVKSQLQGKLRFRTVHQGALYGVQTGANCKAIRIGDFGPSAGGLITEIVNHPGFPRWSPYDPAAIGFESAVGGGGCIDPAAEIFAPADIARRTFPNYPRVAQLVQIYFVDAGVPRDDGEMQTSEDTGSFDSLPYFRGRVVRKDGATITGFEDCWIYFCDVFPAAGAAPQGEIYVGRLMGGAPAGVSEEWRPVYFVHRGAIKTHTAVLSGALNSGSTSTATIFGIASVTVRDRSIPSGMSLANGTTVAITWDDTAGEWIVVGGAGAT